MAIEIRCDLCSAELDPDSFAGIDLIDGRRGRRYRESSYEYCDACGPEVERMLVDALDLARSVSRDLQALPTTEPTVPPPGTPWPEPATSAERAEQIKRHTRDFKRREQAGTPLRKVLVLDRARALAYLHGPNLLTLEECASLTEAEFSAIRGVGAKTLARVREALAARGLSFADDPKDPPPPIAA